MKARRITTKRGATQSNAEHPLRMIRIVSSCLATLALATGCEVDSTEASTKGPYFAVEGTRAAGGTTFTACIEGIELLDPASTKGSEIAANLAVYYGFAGTYKTYGGDGQNCREQFPALDVQLSVSDYNNTVLPAVVATSTTTPTPAATSTTPTTPTTSTTPTTTPAPTTTPTLPSESVSVTPAWSLVSQDAQGNHNTESVIELAGISDDGNKVSFYGWSKNTFGTGAIAPGWGYIYVRNMATATNVVAVKKPDGTPLSLYEPTAWISGSGNVVVFRGSLPRFAANTTSTDGIWRASVGTAGYDLVSIKGLEFGFEMNGTLKVGETIKGSFSSPVPDRDGNSILFLGSQILNDTRAPYNQYNSTAYFNTVLRLDKGAQPVGNQTYAYSHSLLDNTLDVDPGGTYVVLGEYQNSVRRYLLWDMLARNGLGSLFSGVVQQDAQSSFTVCGVSAGAARILVDVSTTQPVPLSDLSAPLSPTKYGTTKLLVFDRAAGTYQLAAAAERKSASTGAHCEDPFGGGLQRQLSSDGNIVMWRDTGKGFYVRNLATEKTVLVPLPSGTIVTRFALSGNGEYIAYEGRSSPGGQSYLNSTGGQVTQIFRIGPIDTSAGRRVTSADFAATHLR